MYKIRISNRVVKEIDDLPNSAFIRVDDIIQNLKIQPRPFGSIKLTDIEGYRIKVGDYRILYTINDTVKEIEIFKVINRKEVYRKK
jgi:mRNA interferase RelE/StbE